MVYLLVAVGSAIGGVARFWLSALVQDRYAGAFPLGTFIVNVTGSLLIGVLLAALPRGSTGLHAFTVVGVLGGFTTFSAFSAQAIELMRNGAFGTASAYVLLSVAVCLLAAYIGILATRSLLAN